MTSGMPNTHTCPTSPWESRGISARPRASDSPWCVDYSIGVRNRKNRCVMCSNYLVGLKPRKGMLMCVIANLLLPKENLALGICKDVTHPRHCQYQYNIILSSVPNYNDLQDSNNTRKGGMTHCALSRCVRLCTLELLSARIRHRVTT